MITSIFIPQVTIMRQTVTVAVAVKGGRATRRNLLPNLTRVLSTSATHQASASTEAAAQQHEVPLKSVYELPTATPYPLLGFILFNVYNRLTKYTMLTDLNKIIFEMAQNFGPIFRVHNPLQPNIVMTARPEDCEVLIQATMKNPVRGGMSSLEKLRREAVDDYFEGRVGLAGNGEEWWRVRSRVQTPMMRPKSVATYITAMDQVTVEFMDRMATFQEKYGEMPEDFQMELYKWALESVGLVALNRRLGCLAPDLSADSEPVRLISLVNDMFYLFGVVEIYDLLWKVYPTKAFKQLKAKHDEFVKLADRNISETEAALFAQDPGQERELTLMESLLLRDGLSRKDVVTVILDMLFAGIDTTSHTLAFTLYLLARNPEKQARLQEEVDAVLAGHKGPLAAMHLANLPYLKAVIKESLRLYPLVSSIGRLLDDDLELNGYLIPKGWIVAPMNSTMCKDEKLFPRAKEFLPERWLRDRPLGPIHPYASLPFGAGTRMCLGRRIVEQELYIFLTRVMQRFTVDYKYQDMGIITRLISTPSLPLKFNITERF